MIGHQEIRGPCFMKLIQFMLVVLYTTVTIHDNCMKHTEYAEYCCSDVILQLRVILSEARYSVMWKMCSLCRNMCDLLLEDVFPWYTLWWQLDSAQCGVFRIGVMVMVYVDIFDSKEPAHAKLIWKNYPPISNINERRCLTGGLSSHLISCVHTWSTSIETSDVYTELNCPDNIDSPRHGRRSDIDQRVLNPQSFQHCAIGIMPISRERKVKQD